MPYHARGQLYSGFVEFAVDLFACVGFDASFRNEGVQSLQPRGCDFPRPNLSGHGGQIRSSNPRATRPERQYQRSPSSEHGKRVGLTSQADPMTLLPKYQVPFWHCRF